MSRADSLNADAAIEAIIKFIHSLEPAPIWDSWYVGTTDEPTAKLFAEHKASYAKSTYVSVDSAAAARRAIRYLIERYGMDGKLGVSEYPRFVYVFKKLADTEPPA